MRIYNATANKITLTDIDRGFAGDKEIYESWNTKTDNTIAATPGYIDVFDSERVMLSTTMGQIKKWVDKGYLITAYSITGRTVGPFVIDATNDTFKVTLTSVGQMIFTLPHGSAVSMNGIVTSINNSATGFKAEVGSFFRSSNTDHITDPVVDGDLSFGYGQRGPSIITGFLVLTSNNIISIDDGNANVLLGFTQGDYTRCI